MTGLDAGRRGTAALAVVLLSVVAAGIVAAAPVSVSVAAPDTAAPGGEFDVTYEVVNEGDEPTDALGLNVTALPANLTVTAIETADGSTAPNRNAVFWVEPVEPGDSVAATFVVAVDDGASLGNRTIEAEITSSDDSHRVSTVVAVEDPAAATTAQQAAGNGTGGDDADGDGGTSTAASTTRSAEAGDAAAAGAGSGALPGGLPLTYVVAGGVALAVVLVSVAVLRRR